MRPRPTHAAAAVLFAVGLAQAGHALYIPVKALVAQHLLVAAWNDARSGSGSARGMGIGGTGAGDTGADGTAAGGTRAGLGANGKGAGHEPARPWPWADTHALARLSAPALDESWIVLSGASGRNLAFAPAHMDGSALPGRRGVSVIAGHRDTHFAALKGAAIGDALDVELPGGIVHRYVISSIDIVDASDTRLRLDAEAPLLMLVTCYPFDALAARGTLRYVVTAVHTSTYGRPAPPAT